MHDLRMALPAVCAWTTAGVVVSTSATIGFGVFAVGLGLCWLASAHPGRRLPLLMLAIVICAVAAVTAWRMTAITNSSVHRLAVDHSLVTIDAMVSRDARSFVAHGSQLVVFDAVVHRIGTRDESFADRVPITIFANASSSTRAARLQMGERFTALGRLTPTDATNRAAKFTVIRLGPVRQEAWWWGASSRMRAAVTESVSQTGREPAALIPALVHGDDQDLDESVKDEFRRTSLTHLLAVSGTNLTIVLVTLLLVGRSVGIRRRGQWVLGALSVVGFILLARPDPSVLRAAAMGSVGLAGLGYGTRGGVRALAWAIVVLVLVNPWLATALGFVLSVCATGGILLLGPPLTAAMARRMPRWLAIAIAVPIAAQLACTPVIAAISGQVSLVSVLANILAGPAVAPATILGLVGGMVGLGSASASHIVGIPAGWCGNWILAVAHWSAALPGAAVAWSGPLWLLGLLCLVAAAGIVWVGARPALFVGLSLGLAICLWRPPTPGWPPAGWIMVACDVGQGDALVLNAGGGAAVVVDTGPEPRLVDRCLRRLGVDRVPLVLLTHLHADHVDGLPGVLAGRRVGQVEIGPIDEPAEQYVDVVRQTSQAGVPLQRSALAEVRTLGGLRWEVLAPARTYRGTSSDPNNSSLVLRVQVAGRTLLLSGDVEPEAQRNLLGRGVDVRADVLKVPHHASNHQEPAFLDAVGATLALTSVGADNTYGHPSVATLGRLRADGAVNFRTDLDGDIAVVVRGGRLSAVVSRGGGRPP